MARCTVSFTVDKAAISGVVKFEPFPNQVIEGVFIDNVPIVAKASGSTYEASLIQKAKYRFVSTRFGFANEEFVVPAESAADLKDLMSGYRAS